MVSHAPPRPAVQACTVAPAVVHACAGEWSPARSFENFLKTAYSLHVVTYKKEEWGVPECEMGNPAELNCATSKGFKSYGIDSHVLAINHVLGKIDLYDLLGELDTAPKKKGGYVKGNAVPHTPTAHLPKHVHSACAECTRVQNAGVRPALTCEDNRPALTQKEQRNRKRALKDKSKKSAAKKAAKPMSKAEGKKKKTVKSKASSSRSKAGSSSLPWFDSSDEDGPQVPVVTARIVGVDSDAGSDSVLSLPYDSDNPGSGGDSSD